MSESKKSQIGTISPQNAFKFIKEHENDSNLVILDIRPRDEFEIEHIQGALNLDYDGHEFKKRFQTSIKKKVINLL